MSDETRYVNPLISRYASRSMAELWGNQRRFSTWRQLWIVLAQAERDLGLDITEQQIAQMQATRESIDFDAAKDYERRFRHDVMAHVHAFGDVAPSARGIIHLGATSCFVTDNAELLLIRDGLGLIEQHLRGVMGNLARFAREQRDQVTLGFTHLQPAQPTTVGKRACLWLHDFLLDFEELRHRLATLRLRGVKGTTGTQASFLALFDGDHEKVRQLDRMVAQRLGFDEVYPVTGQTYSRKIDSHVLDLLSGIAQSAHKCATDLRILAHRKEIEEPFEKEQIGSSAMAYKRNPMRSERICGLARFVMSLTSNAAQTHATQWLERTLDDSANRRLTIPQAFLGVDALLRLMINVSNGLVVYPKVIGRSLSEELPFMATEAILMAAVREGGDRQELHERIRLHSQAAASRVKTQGEPNDLLDRLRGDEAFGNVDWKQVLDPKLFVGRAPEQVDEFLDEVVMPMLGDSEAPSDAEIDV
ncbi:Adenylosuccinate lyase [Planctomycetes bacterium Pan216]|uniref:Adenylosuccinate lyase n=1 Tax=Kolteria novifilia TaxID=2527975 RepID=A0A518BAZ3_9BACT|nr:Adenylosuccinate lyase [Planctomycetes bacterium Pan216]